MRKNENMAAAQDGPIANRMHRSKPKAAGTRLGTIEDWRVVSSTPGKAVCHYGRAIRDGR
jgi:hypothetical protein